ncbi:MAG: hypothetical protein ACK54T_10950 [bacterium]
MRLISAAAAIAVSSVATTAQPGAHRGAGISGVSGVASEPSRSRLPREHVIESILRTSHGASADFLATFNDDSLRHYLERLDAKEKPRGRGAFWLRRPETAAFNAFDTDL